MKQGRADCCSCPREARECHESWRLNGRQHIASDDNKEYREFLNKVLEASVVEEKFKKLMSCDPEVVVVKVPNQTWTSSRAPREPEAGPPGRRRGEWKSPLQSKKNPLFLSRGGFPSRETQQVLGGWGAAARGKPAFCRDPPPEGVFPP